MSEPLVIVDYGVGNLRSAQKAFEHLGQPALVTSDADRIASAPAVVLPGQGAFGTCMENLTAAGLVEPVVAAAKSGRPSWASASACSSSSTRARSRPACAASASSAARSCASRADRT